MLTYDYESLSPNEARNYLSDFVNGARLLKDRKLAIESGNVYNGTDKIIDTLNNLQIDLRNRQRADLKTKIEQTKNDLSLLEEQLADLEYEAYSGT